MNPRDRDRMLSLAAEPCRVSPPCLETDPRCAPCMARRMLKQLPGGKS